MLGGGNFIAQNKALPGAYINFISAAKASANMSERGVVAVPLTLNWGPEKMVFEITSGEFQTSCLKQFGYSFDAPQMRMLREVFLNATKGVFYRLNVGTKAENTYAVARYGGSRGNDLKIVISANVDEESKFDVKTYLENRQVDIQTVLSASELKENDYVMFKEEAKLAAEAGAALGGGTDGAAVTGLDHADFLAAIESYQFQILCCPVTDDTTKALYAAFTKRLRDEAGMKFQTILYRKSSLNYEGIISVENKTEELEQGLVYWVAGASAACAVNKTNENKAYNGELTIDTVYTQNQLGEAVKSGKYMFHKVGNDVKVLMDLNTLTTYTIDKGEEFGSNQTIRVLDQIGNDVAALFNTKYLGTVPNDEAGRISLWNDVITYYKRLAQLRAIEEVDTADVVVSQGENKRAVVIQCPVTPIHCMSQLYMTIIVA